MVVAYSYRRTPSHQRAKYTNYCKPADKPQQHSSSTKEVTQRGEEEQNTDNSMFA